MLYRFHDVDYGDRKEYVEKPAFDSAATALRELYEVVPKPPPRNCSCHLNPPCNDCVEYDGLREVLSNMRATLDKLGEKDHQL
jgi:hypothetical protein